MVDEEVRDEKPAKDKARGRRRSREEGKGLGSRVSVSRTQMSVIEISKRLD